MFDYTLLKALQAIEREGSFRGAARHLRISASAVSQQVKQLEERIGAITVERTTPMHLTELGYKLCKHVEEVMSMEAKVISNNSILFRADPRKPKPIKILVDADSLATWFLDVMQKESQTNIGWLFDLRCRNLEETREDLRAGKASLAVTSDTIPPQGFNRILLGKYRYRAVAGRDFMRRYFNEGVTHETIAKAPVLSGGPNDLQSQWLFQIFKRDISPPSHKVPQSLSFVSATKKNIGWSVNPSEVVQEGIDNGELVDMMPGVFFDRKVFWQYSRAISATVQPITDTVTRIARENLLQDETPTFKVNLAPPSKTDLS